MTALKAAERGVGYLPQDLALFPTMTVREHLEFALRLRRWSRDAVAGRVAELAELLSIGHLLRRRPRALAAARQRVALGRALSFHPRVLLLDEPLSALDDETRHQVYGLLRTVQRQTGVTALHVTHNLSEAKALADRLIVLKDGVITEGKPKE